MVTLIGSELQRYTRESMAPSGETSGAFLFGGLYD
nr:MAG TPA: hypothetical protein [Caudoviricetes sp.]DAU46767.1 MAG TPA: hypothetical protein [Caudoviricetes sp.]